MNRLLFTLLTCAFASGTTFAQVALLKDGLQATGVSDNGVAVGIKGQNSPYYLWDSQTDQSVRIDGISAGNGLGGWGSISADGRYVSGTDRKTKIVSTDLTRTAIDEKYVITQMAANGSTLFAVGKGKDNKQGILVRSSDNGRTWRSASNLPPLPNEGLETICWLNDHVGIAGGWNNAYLVTLDGGNSWSSQYEMPGANDFPQAILGLDFREQDLGVAIVKLSGNKGYGLYHSENGAETWAASEGWQGTPVKVSHSMKGFFLTTLEGDIYRSEKGDQWTKCEESNDNELNDVAFADGKNGLAVGNKVVLKTTDGGENWEAVALDTERKWNTVCWKDNKVVYLAGEDEQIMRSEDGGESWQSLNADQEAEGGNINDLYLGGTALVACADNSVFYTQNLSNTSVAYQMARYDKQTNQWTTLGDLGDQSGFAASNGYYVSADGKSIAGNAYKIINPNSFNSKQIAVASVWDEATGKIHDLGSRYAERGRSSRVDAINADGTVAVGWQDEHGPWHSSVWKKQADGSWSEGKYILLDPAKGETADNIMRQCSAVSPNGKWVGGSGQAAENSGPLALASEGLVSEPYIWSEESGVIRLGMTKDTPATNGFKGVVRGVNDEGTVAVGFFDTSKFGVVPNMYPFIWTKEEGIQNLNTYVKEKLGADLGRTYLASALSLSPNGRYIAGWGIDEGGKFCAFVVDLQHNTTGNETVENTLTDAKVYTANGGIHVELPGEVEQATYSLFSLQGTQLKTGVVGSRATIATSGLPEGIYIFNLLTNQGSKSVKISVKE